MKRKIFGSAVLAMLMFTGAIAEEQISFEIGWTVDSARGQAIQKIVDNYNTQNKGQYNVKMVSGDKIDNTKMMTKLLSPRVPEVMQMTYSHVQSFAGQEMLRDMGFMANEVKGHYYPEIMELATYDGKLVAVPWIGHTIQMVYNRDILRKAGIEKVPATWEEVIEASKVIKEKTGVEGFGISGSQHYDTLWMTMPVLYSYGSKIVEGEGRDAKITINSPEGIKALKVLQELFNQYSSSTTANGGKIMEDFRNQRIAMEMQGPWGITDIWKSGNPFEVESALMPAGTAGWFADVGVESLIIPGVVKGKKLAAAENFIKYMVSNEAQLAIMNGEYDEKTGKYYPFRVPVRNDLTESDFFTEYPQFNVFIEGFKSVSNSMPTPAWLKVANEVWNPVMNELALGKLTPEQAAVKIEREGNRAIKEYFDSI